MAKYSDTSTKNVSLYPKMGTVKTSIGERQMGRLLQAAVPLHVGLFDSQATDDLVSDVFYSLYKAEPSVMDEAPRSRFLNHALVRMLHTVPNFQSLRSNTIADITTSMVSASMVTSALMSDEAVREAMILQDKLEQLKQQMEEMQKQLQESMQAAGYGSNGEPGEDESDSESDGQGSGPGEQQDDRQPSMQESSKQRQQRQIKKEQENIKKRENEIATKEKELKKSVEKFDKSALAKGMVSSAVDEGGDAADSMRSMMASWGIEKGEVSYDDANHLNSIAVSQGKQLALIAELGGRVAGVSASTLQSVRDSYVGAPSEPTYTRDFLRMFPTERAYMSHLAPPVIRALKVSQWAERGVLGLRPKSEGKKRGALVIAVDGSSSMDAHLCSMKDETGMTHNLDRGATAKILATGVARAMREDRFEQRRYTLFTFSVQTSQIMSTTSADTWRELMRWIEYDPNGGTDFNTALAYAINEMEKFEMEGTLGADLLFISDGEAEVSNRIKRRLLAYKERTGARMFYLQVTGKDSRYSQDGTWAPKDINLNGVVDAFVVISKEGDIQNVPEYLAQQVSAVFAQVGD